MFDHRGEQCGRPSPVILVQCTSKLAIVNIESQHGVGGWGGAGADPEGGSGGAHWRPD
jgi:hypothetical protein